MPDLKFQFQFGPDDLKAIRAASNIVPYSPATTLTAWICGLAVCLLILGAIGYWSVLSVMTVLAFSFLAFHVHRISRRHQTGQQSAIHTLTLTDSKLTETCGQSHFEKSWDAFDEFRESKNHFILRHYERITVLPKRVVPADRLEICRTLMGERVGRNRSGALPAFDDWFKTGFGNPVYHFHWQVADIEMLARARLRIFHPSELDSMDTSGKPSFWKILAVLAVAGMILSLLAVATIVDQPGRASWMSILIFPLAISVPFAVAFVWWKYTTALAGKRVPRFPGDKIHVTHNDKGVLIGYSNAIAQYGWPDISALYVGERFIGFRHHDGLVHVIANHAFGGRNQAVEFLLTAEQYWQRYGPEPRPKPPAFIVRSPQETGNPYQPPAHMK